MITLNILNVKPHLIVELEQGKPRSLSGSTSKIRKIKYPFEGVRIFPFYLMIRRSYPKKQQKLIVEESKNALALI